MIYKISNKKEEVHKILDQNLYFGILTLEELERDFKKFGIEYSSIERCKDMNYLNQNIVLPHKDYFFGIMSLINSKNIFLKKDVFGFFVFKNIFLIMVIEDDDEHIYKVFNETYEYIEETHISLARVVYLFLNGLIINDYQYLERLQEEIDELEQYNSKESSIVFTNKLKQINKELILLRNYYENIVSIGEELQMNYHHFFNQDDLKYIEIYIQRILRLSHNIAILQELAIQSREVHQSKIDYSMNQTMQLFTVVTTIFMPLTLITGWYGMNFVYMPELDYPYGYYILIIISVVIVLGCIYWFKKKKYF